MAFQKETEVSTCIYLLEIGSLDLEVTMIVQPGFDPNISNQDRVIYSRHSCGVVGVLNSGAPRRWPAVPPASLSQVISRHVSFGDTTPSSLAARRELNSFKFSVILQRLEIGHAVPLQARVSPDTWTSAI